MRPAKTGYRECLSDSSVNVQASPFSSAERATAIVHHPASSLRTGRRLTTTMVHYTPIARNRLRSLPRVPRRTSTETAETNLRFVRFHATKVHHGGGGGPAGSGILRWPGNRCDGPSSSAVSTQGASIVHHGQTSEYAVYYEGPPSWGASLSRDATGYPKYCDSPLSSAARIRSASIVHHGWAN